MKKPTANIFLVGFMYILIFLGISFFAYSILMSVPKELAPVESVFPLQEHEKSLKQETLDGLVFTAPKLEEVKPVVDYVMEILGKIANLLVIIIPSIILWINRKNNQPKKS
jgi:hypothetical protein